MLAFICMWVSGLIMGVCGTMMYLGRRSEYDFGEVLLCLHGATYCMTHDVMDDTKTFELEHIKALIEKLEGR